MRLGTFAPVQVFNLHVQPKNAHTAVHEWSLGPLLEFLILEANQEEQIHVATLLQRIVPDYHNANLLQAMQNYSLTSALLEASNLPRIRDAKTLQCGAAVFHPVRGSGQISAIDVGANLPFTVLFDSTEIKTYAAALSIGNSNVGPLWAAPVRVAVIKCARQHEARNTRALVALRICS